MAERRRRTPRHRLVWVGVGVGHRTLCGRAMSRDLHFVWSGKERVTCEDCLAASRELTVPDEAISVQAGVGLIGASPGGPFLEPRKPRKPLRRRRTSDSRSGR